MKILEILDRIMTSEDKEAIGKINWGRPANLPLSMGGIHTVRNNVANTYKADVTFAGILVTDFIPSIGETGNEAGLGMDTGLFKFFTDLRDKNMSLSPYSKADLAKFTIGLDSIYLIWTQCVRDLALSAKFEFINAAIGRPIASALGNFVTGDRANYIARMNQIQSMLVKLPIPALPMVQRHMSLVSDIYADDDGKKTQLIGARTKYYYYWNTSANDTHPGACTLEQLPSGFDNRLNLLYNLIEKYANDDDACNMASEIVKAYGGGYYYVEPLTEESLKNWDFKYDYEVIDMIRNTTFVGEPYIDTPTYTWDINEDAEGNVGNGVNWQTGYATHKLYTTNARYNSASDFSVPNTLQLPLFCHGDKPSSEQVINAMSCTAFLEFNGSIYQPQIRNFGTEIFTQYHYWHFTPNGWAYSRNFTTYMFNADLNINDLVTHVCRLHQLVCIPYMYYNLVTGASSTDTLFVTGDVDNVTLVDFELMKTMRMAYNKVLWSYAKPGSSNQRKDKKKENPGTDSK